MPVGHLERVPGHACCATAMGKARPGAPASTFENPLDGDSGLATFERDDDDSGENAPKAPEHAPHYDENSRPTGSLRIAPKKRATTEYEQLLNSDEAGMETDWFDFFCSALTKITAHWDPAADLFASLDDDGSGELGRAEVRTALRERLSNKQIKQAFEEMDADGGGTIDIEEFREWWEKRVVSTSGSFHAVLGQLSREQTKLEMKKCFDTSDLPGAETSPFLSLGSKPDAPMNARDFWDSVEMHTSVKLSDSDREQLANELYNNRSKTPSGEIDRTEVFTVQEFLTWWEHFFEFDVIDQYAIAMQVLDGQRGLINPFSKFRGDWDMIQTLLLFYIMMAVPYRIGFDDPVQLWSTFFWIDLLIDIYFMCAASTTRSIHHSVCSHEIC